MNVAIISDTHLPRGTRRLPDQCVAMLRRADHILHAGDLTSAAVLGDLQSLGPPVSAVAGNVDEPALQSALAQSLQLELEGVTIAMVHDAGPSAGRLERLHRLFPDARAVVFGHSHIPLVSQGGGLTIFNPGSPTDRRRAPEHSMGIAEIAAGEIALRHVWLGA